MIRTMRVTAAMASLAMIWTAPVMAQGAPEAAHPARPAIAAAHAERPATAAAHAEPSTADIVAVLRLFDVMKYRDRQSVLTLDTLRAARTDLLNDCLERAASLAALKTCDSVADAGGSGRAISPALLDEIIAASAEVFAANFSKADLAELTRFFESPIGHKYSNAYPRVLADIQARKRRIVRSYLLRSTPTVKAEKTSGKEQR